MLHFVTDDHEDTYVYPRGHTGMTQSYDHEEAVVFIWVDTYNKQ